MATRTSARLSKTNSTNQNDSIVSLIWLDSDLDETGIQEVEQRLRSIISRLDKFQNVTQCKRCIENQSQNRIILVVSGQLGRELVPEVNALPQIASIYVYCMNKDANKQWSSSHGKVRCVVTEIDELIFRLKADYESQRMVREHLPINFFSSVTDGNKSTANANAQFIFFQVFFECITRLTPSQADKDELIHQCETEFTHNDFEKKNIRLFDQHYKPDKALNWYTYDSFFRRTLYTALQTENTHMIFLFHQFISDIQQKLKTHQISQSLKVYRCQMLTSEQINNFKTYCDQYVSVNTFFSTSSTKEHAISFLDIGDSSDSRKPVLFEINADPTVVTGKPFGDISPHADYPEQAEILFMPASIFHVQSVQPSSDSPLYIIKMGLCGEQEENLRSVFGLIQQQLGNGETNLHTFGKLFWKAGKHDLANHYYIRFSKTLPPNDPLLIPLYEDLAELTSYIGDIEKSSEWHNKATALQNSDSSVAPAYVHKRKISIVAPNIGLNARWAKNAMTVAGGQGLGKSNDRLYFPWSVYIDDSQMMIIADTSNHRIVQWRIGDAEGKTIVGNRGIGSGVDQLSFPSDVIVDKTRDSLIICDQGNRRVLQLDRQAGASKPVEILLENVYCRKVFIDEQGDLYIVDTENHEIRRCQRGKKCGVVVAGGQGQGDGLDQLNMPTSIFVDRYQSVYISDSGNHRVMKWTKNATHGSIVAGGQGNGDGLSQLSHPNGLFVDTSNTIYIADSRNNRIMSWSEHATQGIVIAGGNGEGDRPNQFNGPSGLFIDRNGHLFVVDMRNHRIQRFSIQ